MNIRSNKKSIIMVSYIIIIAAIIALGTRHAHAARPIIGKDMQPLVTAFLQGGPGGNTIAGPGFSMLNAETQIFMCATGDNTLPGNMCVTIVNLSEAAIQLVGMMRVGESSPIGMMIEPGQTKAFCLPPDPVHTSLGLMMMDGNRGHGFALWHVVGGIDPETF